MKERLKKAAIRLAERQEAVIRQAREPSKDNGLFYRLWHRSP
jgi:hypothetical protein